MVPTPKYRRQADDESSIWSRSAAWDRFSLPKLALISDARAACRATSQSSIGLCIRMAGTVRATGDTCVSDARQAVCSESRRTGRRRQAMWQSYPSSRLALRTHGRPIGSVNGGYASMEGAKKLDMR